MQLSNRLLCAASAAVQSAQGSGALFKVLTWNIANGQMSWCQPEAWKMETHTAAVCNEINKHQADIVCLQEQWQGFQNLLDQYDSFGFVRAHSGYVSILLRKGSGLVPTQDPTELHEEKTMPGGFIAHYGPGVVIPVKHEASGAEFWVASCHLPPGQDSYKDKYENKVRPFARKRKQHMQRMLGVVPHGQPVVIAGDTNMGAQELTGIRIVTLPPNKKVWKDSLTPARDFTSPPPAVHKELGLIDAWEATGSDPTRRFTIDGKKNLFYERGVMYQARYDRILYRMMECKDFRIVCNKFASQEPGHFLSDHFGVTATLSL